MEKKKIIIKNIILLIISLIIGGNTALATNTSPNMPQDKIIPSDKNAIVMTDTGAKIPEGNPGEPIIIYFQIAVNKEYAPSSNYILRNITIKPKIPANMQDMEEWPFLIENVSDLKTMQDMTYNSIADIYYDFTISQKAKKGTYPVHFEVNATVWRRDELNGTLITEDVTNELTTYINILTDGAESNVSNENGALAIATTDEDGNVMPAPSGNAGDRVDLRLPLLNTGGLLTDINISPVLSTNLNEWPFVAEVINYGKYVPYMYPEDIIILEYSLRISPEITAGAKPMNFRATYKENGIYKESLFSAFIDVAKGKEEPKEPKELPDSVPKIIITEYITEPEDVVPGKAFNLTLTFKNTSKNKAVKNIGISLTFDTSQIIPAEGKLDSGYINYLKPQQEEKLTFELNALPSILEQVTSIVANMTYETTKVTQGNWSQAILIPIQHELNIEHQDYTIFADRPMINEPVAVNIKLVNKGRTKALNLTIDVESDDVVMLEPYYGGDLLPAAETGADFQIVSKKAGEVEGNFIITYEDLKGNPEEQKIPFSFVVSEEEKKDEIVESDVKDPAKQKKTVAGLALLAIIAGVGGTYYYLKNKKKIG